MVDATLLRVRSPGACRCTTLKCENTQRSPPSRCPCNPCARQCMLTIPLLPSAHCCVSLLPLICCRHTVTLSHLCHTCRAASSPRRLPRFSGHAAPPAAASMRCDFPPPSSILAQTSLARCLPHPQAKQHSNNANGQGMPAAATPAAATARRCHRARPAAECCPPRPRPPLPAAARRCHRPPLPPPHIRPPRRCHAHRFQPATPATDGQTLSLSQSAKPLRGGGRPRVSALGSSVVEVGRGGKARQLFDMKTPKKGF